jgi:hypothetical protein
MLEADNGVCSAIGGARGEALNLFFHDRRSYPVRAVAASEFPRRRTPVKKAAPVA